MQNIVGRKNNSKVDRRQRNNKNNFITTILRKIFAKNCMGHTIFKYRYVTLFLLVFLINGNFDTYFRSENLFFLAKFTRISLKCSKHEYIYENTPVIMHYTSQIKYKSCVRLLYFWIVTFLHSISL